MRSMPLPTLAEPDVEQHALRLETPGVFDHGVRRRTVGRLDVPATRRQRQLEADGNEGVVLDDEHPGGHADTAGSSGIE